MCLKRSSFLATAWAECLTIKWWESWNNTVIQNIKTPAEVFSWKWNWFKLVMNSATMETFRAVMGHKSSKLSKRKWASWEVLKAVRSHLDLALDIPKPLDFDIWWWPSLMISDDCFWAVVVMVMAMMLLVPVPTVGPWCLKRHGRCTLFEGQECNC